jgi:hypothetical protein
LWLSWKSGYHTGKAKGIIWMRKLYDQSKNEYDDTQSN